MTIILKTILIMTLEYGLDLAGSGYKSVSGSSEAVTNVQFL